MTEETGIPNVDDEVGGKYHRNVYARIHISSRSPVLENDGEGGDFVSGDSDLVDPAEY